MTVFLIDRCDCKRKSPNADTMRLSCVGDAVMDDSFRPTPRAKIPPYFLQLCVQIVLTTYRQTFTRTLWNSYGQPILEVEGETLW